MKSVILHNTLTGKKEAFTSLKQGEVGLYVCGITPYDESHLGHGRCYVVFDLLKRVLKKAGYKVRHIQNFTDIDDKIINRANQIQMSPFDLAQKNIDSFFDRMKQLNVLPADQYPRVTTSISLIIGLIEKLIKNGFAYVQNGDVNFEVRKFLAYGALSKRKIDELEAGARVQIDESKKDPLDFALWKKAKPGEPFWESPWGQGRPGWHIECSAMSIHDLGEEFDIHGGGQDLIFPHHENEIAQSVGATHKSFAKTWVHNGFVTINQEKMSKSLGNFFTLKDILTKTDPMVVRYFLLSQHYRSPLNFSDVDMAAVGNAWVDRISGAYKFSAEKNASSMGEGELPPESKNEIEKLSMEFEGALFQDLNTPAALGALNKYCSLVYKLGEQKPALSKVSWGQVQVPLGDMLDVLGLVVKTDDEWGDDVLQLVKQRQSARAAKEWAKSDEIRNKLKAMGLVVEDTSTGPRVKRI